MGPLRRDQCAFLDGHDQVLRYKTVRLVRVLWRHYGVEEFTWEHEDDAGHLSLLV